MDCSTPGLPVHHQLLEFTQTHVHWVGDAIQPMSSPSPLAFSLSQHQGLFQWVSSLHQMTKKLEIQLQIQSFQWVFRVNFPYDWLVWSPWCLRDSQQTSPAPQFKGNNSLAVCLLYSPVFTTIYDHWEDHILEYTDLCQQSNVSAFQQTLFVVGLFLLHTIYLL